MLLDVPVLDIDVNGVGGQVHLLVTVHPVHQGAVHGSVVNLELALCGSSEGVLLGDPLLEAWHSPRLDGDLGLVPCVVVAGIMGGCFTVGGGTAKAFCVGKA